VHSRVLLGLLGQDRPGEIAAWLYGDVSGTRIVVENWSLCASPDLEREQTRVCVERLPDLSSGGVGRLIGIAHTHPLDPPVPSLVDHYFLERSPFLWLIVGRDLVTAEAAVAAFGGGTALVKSLRIVVTQGGRQSAL
jgi:proteasome lid subunit RPN8/RPN11